MGNSPPRRKSSGAGGGLEDPIMPPAAGDQSEAEAQWAQSETSATKLQEQKEFDDGQEWVSDLADEYDYCLVFPPEKPGQDHYLESYTSRLAEYGLEMFCYKETLGDGKLYVLVRPPVGVLRAYADSNNFMMLLDETYLESAARAGWPEYGIKPIEIGHKPDVIKYRPFEFIYCKYSQRVDEQMYYREPGDSHPFARDVIRLKILCLLIESRPIRGGENLKLQRYLRWGRLLGAFPLHDVAKRRTLAHAWMAGSVPWKMPFLRIKEYMGEKIGLYYVFMGHYNRFLVIPAFVGVPIQLAVFFYSRKDPYEGYNDAPFLPFYSFFVSLWAIFMLEFWKRREKRTALEWGTSGQEDHDVPQPEFRGDRIKSFIDGGDNYIHFPSTTRNKYVFQSSLAIFGLTLLVMGVVASVYTLKTYLQNNGLSSGNAQLYASVINSVQIQLTNLLYTFLANELTQRENHRTQAKYDDALVVKIFVFQFINSFTSFFYLAFLTEVVTDSPNCSSQGCMYSLSVNLITIFLLRLITQNVVGLLIPWLTFRYKVAGGAIRELLFSKKSPSRSRPELEFLLEPYNSNSAFIDDMMDAVIQFGYMTLFVTAFPGTAALALVSNVIGLKGKAWKLLNVHQRPTPVAAEDIGQFQSLLLITSICAVITNAALTVFTMNVLDSFSDTFRFWIFIGFQWICFAAQAIIMEAIPDEPESIVFHKKRAAFLESKVIDRVADDEVAEYASTDARISVQQYPTNRGGFFRPRSSSAVAADAAAASAAEVAAIAAADAAAAPVAYSVDVIPPQPLSVKSGGSVQSYSVDDDVSPIHSAAPPRL